MNNVSARILASLLLFGVTTWTGLLQWRRMSCLSRHQRPSGSSIGPTRSIAGSTPAERIRRGGGPAWSRKHRRQGRHEPPSSAPTPSPSPPSSRTGSSRPTTSSVTAKSLSSASIRRRMYMVSPTAADMDGLFVASPDVPLPTCPSKSSSRWRQNDRGERTAPRRGTGSDQIHGTGDGRRGALRPSSGERERVQCSTRAASPNWLMRYRNSPVIAIPRYLPERRQDHRTEHPDRFQGVALLGGQHRSELSPPEGYTQMATMHESAGGGPRTDTSMLLAENTGRRTTVRV